MAKKTTKSSSLIKKIEDDIFTNQAYLDMKKELRSGNGDDYPELRERGKRKATAEEKKEENRVKIRIKRLQQMLKNAKARGGGSLGGSTVGGLAAGSRNNAIKKLMKDM